VARLNPAARQGRAFGGYGLCKSPGYAVGPLLGGLLFAGGGLRLLFTVLAVLAAVVAAAAAVTVPAVAPQPRRRRRQQTVLDLARRLTSRGFLGPVASLAAATAALAAATAALAAAVGFLPVRGEAAGLGPRQEPKLPGPGSPATGRPVPGQPAHPGLRRTARCRRGGPPAGFPGRDLGRSAELAV
jgi:MFS family permease